jgi:hypothetical protein
MTASHVVKTGSDGHLSKSSIGAANSHKTSIWARTVSGSGTCFFNYHSGTPSTVTDQWQRFEVTSNTAHIYPVNFRGTSTLTDIYIWGAQLETGSVATSYIPTSGGDAAARTRAADDLQIERDSTNLVSYSTPDTNWPLSGATRIEDFASSPDGSQTATKITKVGTDANERTFFEDVALSNGTQYSASVYLKNVDVQGYTTLGVRVAGGTLFRIQINWSTNTVFNNNGATFDRFVREAGDGWYRIGFSFTADGTNSDFEIDVDRSGATATDTSSVLVWGAQLEEGDATSLIQTSGAPASRTTFSDFYNQSEGTVYIELTSEDDGKNSYPVYFTQDIAGHTERNNGTWAIQKDVHSNVYLASWANGGFISNSLISLGGYTAGNLTRVSVSYDSNSYEGSKDGASVQTSTPTTMATTLVDRLFVGGSGAFQNSSRIKRLIYWPTSSDRL